jgi:hypothetical protein
VKHSSATERAKMMLKKMLDPPRMLVSRAYHKLRERAVAWDKWMWKYERNVPCYTAPVAILRMRSCVSFAL